MLKDKPPARGTKGRQTRERLLGAAVAEFKRDGMAGADIAAIVSAAGVAHATFFFHFPTKEHVLFELEEREEERIAADLARFFATPHDVRSTLTETLRSLTDLERRLGHRLFKDFLGLHFSSTRPPSEEVPLHPVIVTVVEELGRARERGEIPSDTDVFHKGVSFLAGLYALLIMLPPDRDVRAPFLDEYISTYMLGLRASE
ncbi:TetR family transcriptional regulator [Nocardia blacklockiae]|uniref:TetR family transcriptional regulator n=1 Tax=Nocardia blacklockiae TaxID=480036 RepID=UPI0018932145|nr:TetR/AcrR family transcriptional regulator [Nocardia blacklockiae]MBF6171575.1 TetR/AcrR family transcriptional regulator [Nocardia blacklockiae]